MATTTAISWTSTFHPDGTVAPGSTWNPVTGCSHVSEGCRNCYAEALSLRYGWSKLPWTAPNAAQNVRLHPERLDQPRKWRTPRKVFVNSMSDLFHEQVPFEFIAQCWDVMFDCAGLAGGVRHEFQVLTKRPQRLLEFARWMHDHELRRIDYPNVWLGVSVEDQRAADERIPLLVQVPAAIRFLSCEPLLGPLDLTPWLPVLDWVICGGESGPHSRRMELQWARSLQVQCAENGVAFWFKQAGGLHPGRGEDALGAIYHEFPQAAVPA